MQHHQSILDEALELLEKSNGEDLTIFFNVAWRLWLRKYGMEYKCVEKSSLKHLREAWWWLTASKLPKPSVQPNQVHFDRILHHLSFSSWIFFDLKKVGIWFIVRDYNGKPFMAVSITEREVPNPKYIEALVILRSLWLCLHQEIPNIIVESNCLLLVQDISLMKETNYVFGNIIMDIREQMSLFPFYKI